MTDDELLARLDDCFDGCPAPVTTAPVSLLRTAAARLRELIAERDSFYVEYRMRNDAESKAALVRAESAERELAETVAARDRAQKEITQLDKIMADLAKQRNDAQRERDDLRALLLDTRATLSHAQTFIASREKMHPFGIELYQENIRRVDRALAPEGGMNERLTLTGSQISALHDFCGGVFDEGEFTVERFDACNDAETGELMPAGLYVYCTDCPEEGRVYLGPDHDEQLHASLAARSEPAE